MQHHYLLFILEYNILTLSATFKRFDLYYHHFFLFYPGTTVRKTPLQKMNVKLIQLTTDPSLENRVILEKLF